MSHRTTFAVVSAFFLALLTLSLAPVTRAETDALKVDGTIYTLDLTAKAVTIKKSDNSTITLHFSKATLRTRNGKTVKLKAFMLQDAVSARYKANLTLTKFSATGPKGTRVAGKLENALKGNGTVVVNGKTLQTTARTRISRNGKLVSLSQLTRQDTLVAHVAAGASGAVASGNPEASDIVADGPEDGEVHGLISGILGNQVTVNPDNGTADVVLNVTDDTMIEVDGHTAALADLKTGMQIEATFDPTTNNAFSIETDSEGEFNDSEIHGTVTAVDATGGTITIAPKTGSLVTLNVDASTEIKVNDADATLADIQVNMPAEAKYDSTTMHAMEIKAGSGDDNHQDSSVEGTVAAVDTGAQTVTIAPHGGGSDVVLNVTTETEIEVNGEDAGIGDIVVGQPARAEYDPATNDAFEIKVGSDDEGGEGDQRVEGPVTAVSTGNSTVTIDPADGDAVTLTVNGDTEIKVNGKDGTLADVQVGQNAKAKYDASTMVASELEVGDDDAAHR